MRSDHSLIELTADMASAYVSGNKLEASELPSLIQSIYSSLASVGEPPPPAQPENAKATAAQIRKSMTNEGLISFEDGRTYQTLKRHLGRVGLTPAQYIMKWGLPSDYPMTAPAYSARRSELAKSAGLGRKRANNEATSTKATTEPVANIAMGSSKPSLTPGRPNPKVKKT